MASVELPRCQDCSCCIFKKVLSIYQEFSLINALNDLPSESHPNHLATNKHLEMLDTYQKQESFSLCIHFG